MAERKKVVRKENLKTGERWKGWSFSRVGKKRNEGWWTRLQEKEKTNYDHNNAYEVQNTKTICVSIGTRPKNYPSEPLKGMKPQGR